MQPSIIFVLLAAFALIYVRGSQDCRDDCLDDFGQDIEECILLPPGPQAECMEDAATVFVACISHCTNRTISFQAINIFMKACINQSLTAPNDCLHLMNFAIDPSSAATTWCKGDFYSCRQEETHE